MTGTTGGCQCGAVRYRVDQALDNAHVCHCRMCQKASGNYFLPLARTAKAKFDRDTINVTLGSLDDPAAVRPGVQCGLQAKQPWFDALDTLEPWTDEASWYAAIAPSNHQHPDHDTEQWPLGERS